MVHRRTDPCSQRGITCPQTDAALARTASGTLAEWQTAVPAAKVLRVSRGFSLGSGVRGDGVLRAQTYGGEEYIFTDEENAVPSTPEVHTQSRAVTAQAPDSSVESFNRHFITRLTTNSCPADDTCRGKKVTWKVTIDGGSLRYQHTDGWNGQTDLLPSGVLQGGRCPDGEDLQERHARPDQERQHEVATRSTSREALTVDR